MFQITKWFVLFLIFLSGSLRAQISYTTNQLYSSSDSLKQIQLSGFHDKIDSFSYQNAWIHLQANEFHLGLVPMVDMLIGYESKSEEFIHRFGVGAQISSTYKKWNFRASYLTTQGQYLPYQERYISKKHIVPTMNVARGGKEPLADFLDVVLQYKSKRFFTFEAGYGRSFIGDGYRSLLLSDFANASPYAKMQTSFWKIKYTNLFAIHYNIYGVENRNSLFLRKYSATHFLDWQILNWLSIGVFESIIWSGKESSYNRGFDLHYLNPVIFYRPVEFSVGSSDNAILGSNIKITPTKTQKLYFQLLFDEFLLDELRADFNQLREPNQDIKSGWWANKYGIQLGWQGQNNFGIKGFSHLLEYNLVRPFTYAHSDPIQAYSNYNQSLAHPIGANFQEFISRLQFQKKKWVISLQYNNSLRGLSPVGTNFGDNLELSNQNREKEYENYIGQGIESRTQIADMKLSYVLKPEWNLTLSLGYFWREEMRAEHNLSDRFVYLRFRTNLFNQYFDF